MQLIYFILESSYLFYQVSSLSLVYINQYYPYSLCKFHLNIHQVYQTQVTITVLGGNQLYTLIVPVHSLSLRYEFISQYTTPFLVITQSIVMELPGSKTVTHLLTQCYNLICNPLQYMGCIRDAGHSVLEVTLTRRNPLLPLLIAPPCGTLTALISTYVDHK